jgi:hypothetical protein
MAGTCPQPVLRNVEAPTRRACPERSRRACPEQRRRGGRRPGAGAPTGNLNALQHGRHSAQLRALIALFRAPAVEDVIARLLRRQAQRRRRLQRDAAALGLWLRHLDPDVPSPPVPLPRLTRRQTRLFAQALLHRVQYPPVQSNEKGPKTALPDTTEEKNSRKQSKFADTARPPNEGAAPNPSGRPSGLQPVVPSTPCAGAPASPLDPPTAAPVSPPPATPSSAPASRWRPRSPARFGSPSPGR